MANLSFSELASLWVAQGGVPAIASTMAGIALAESGGNPNALNPLSCRQRSLDDEPCNFSTTGDYSIGLWQINYYGGLFNDRVKAFGPPSALYDPAANARAAVALARDGSGLGNWTTYTSGAYRKFLGKSAGMVGPVGGQSTTTGRRAVSAPPGFTGPVGVQEHLPEAFQRFVHALGVTLPTRTKLSDHLSRRFTQAVR